LLDKCVVTDGNRAALSSAESWIEGDQNLWFYGAPGSGKTHIAAAAMNDGPIGHCYFVNVARMLLDFQASVKEHDEKAKLSKYTMDGSYSRMNEHEREGQTRATSILFDDVGAHRVSDFGLEMFGLLLEHFYSYGTTGLIFTSNLSPKQILETMGERIASRLQGLAKPIKVEGEDWRLK